MTFQYYPVFGLENVFIREIIDIIGEEPWPKQGTLWHSATDILSLGGTTIYNGKLLSVC